jgi:dihydrofolate reductase
MAEVVLFHSVLGLRPGVIAAADRLRAAGHTVYTPDFYDGEMFDDPSVFERVYGNLVEETGAVIMGRRSYDNSIEAWGGKGPLGDVVPCFVVTHRPPASADPVFTFVTDGIESALAKAQEVAGDKRIGLMGANVDQQFLAAGLVDEIRIHLVNVLLGGGRSLFDGLPQRIELEQTGLSETDGVRHLGYRVVR